MKFFVLLLVCLTTSYLTDRILAEGTTVSPAVEMISTSLTLNQALEYGRQNNPTWLEHAANRETALANVSSSKIWPNPELEIGAGQARSRAAPTEKANEYELSISQPIELPHKRKLRRKAANAAVAVAENERAVFSNDLRSQIARAYANARYFQDAIALREQAQHLARELEILITRRVEGGEVAKIDLIKAGVERLQAETATRTESRNLAAARVALECLCGNVLPEGWQSAEALPASLQEISLDDALHSARSYHPELRRIDAVLVQRRAEMDREHAAWHPDLKPGISVARELDSESFRLQIGIELPFFNRNQGGIAGARAAIHKAQAERQRAEQVIIGQVRTGWQSYQSSREQLAAYAGGLLSGTREALATERFLYEQGEHDLLQLLDARRTAQATENEALSAALAAALARVDLEHAMGAGGNGE